MQYFEYYVAASIQSTYMYYIIYNSNRKSECNPNVLVHVMAGVHGMNKLYVRDLEHRNWACIEE